jgi:hypothetical protein
MTGQIRRLFAGEVADCLSFDFPGLLIGTAEYPEGPTGSQYFSSRGGLTELWTPGAGLRAALSRKF